MARGPRRKAAVDAVPLEPSGISDLLRTGINARFYADFMETCEHLDEIRRVIKFNDEELCEVMKYLAETRGS